MTIFTDDICSVISKYLTSNNLINLKTTTKDIETYIKKDFIIDMKVKEIEYELEKFKPLEKLYYIRKNRLILNKTPLNLSIFEYYEKDSKVYNLEYHKIIVINDIFESLESFIELYLDKNITYTREDIIKNIIKIFANKLNNHTLEKKSEILRDISASLV